MIDVDSTLISLILSANTLIKELNCNINQYQFKKDYVRFFVDDELNDVQVPLDISFEQISYFATAKTTKAKEYIVKCLVNKILFDYEEKNYQAVFDDNNKITYPYWS